MRNVAPVRLYGYQSRTNFLNRNSLLSPREVQLYNRPTFSYRYSSSVYPIRRSFSRQFLSIYCICGASLPQYYIFTSFYSLTYLICYLTNFFQVNTTMSQKISCEICEKRCRKNQKYQQCCNCKKCIHQRCTNLSPLQFSCISGPQGQNPFVCDLCTVQSPTSIVSHRVNNDSNGEQGGY